MDRASDHKARRGADLGTSFVALTPDPFDFPLHWRVMRRKVRRGRSRTRGTAPAWPSRRTRTLSSVGATATPPGGYASQLARRAPAWPQGRQWSLRGLRRREATHELSLADGSTPVVAARARPRPAPRSGDRRRGAWPRPRIASSSCSPEATPALLGSRRDSGNASVRGSGSCVEFCPTLRCLAAGDDSLRRITKRTLCGVRRKASVRLRRPVARRIKLVELNRSSLWGLYQPGGAAVTAPTALATIWGL